MGRLRQLQALSACAGRARSGHPQVVLVQGEAGIGKSALIRQWLTGEQADGFRVLRAVCDASEADVTFGVVNQLLASVPPALVREIRPSHADIPPDTTSFHAGTQVLRLLDQLQADGPVVIVVDDVHWADRGSVQALSLVLRRLQADAVLTVLTTRTGTGTTRPMSTVEDDTCRLIAGRQEITPLFLGGLSAADIAELSEQLTGRPMSHAVTQRLHHHTQGHPVHLRTVITQASPAQLRGGREPLPVPMSLAAAVGRQLAAMPHAARAMVEAASVLNARTPLALVGRVADVTDPTAALEPGLAAGLLSWWPSEPSIPVAVSHPLYRRAVLDRISPKRLRAMHAAAVPVVDAAASWAHRVAATDGPDRTLAEELEKAAVEQLAAHNAPRAATLLLWAADVWDSRAERERCLLAAAVYLMEADQLPRVQQLLPEVESCAPSPPRDLVLGGCAAAQGDLTAAEDRLTGAVRAAQATRGLEQIAALGGVWLGRVYAMLGRGRELVELSESMLATAQFSPRLIHNIRANRATGRAFSDGPQAGLREFADLPEAARARAADAELLGQRGVLRVCSGRFHDGIEDVTAALRFHRGKARPVLLHPLLSLAQYSLGAWDDAVITAEKAVEIPLAEEQPWALPIGLAIAALVPAGRGEWDQAQDLLARAERWAWRMSETALAAVAGAQAALARAQSDPEAMLTALQPLRRLPHASAVTVAQLWWRPLEAEALLGTGRLDEAERALRGLERLAGSAPCAGTPASLLSGRLAQARGDATRARAAYERGLRLPSPPDDMPLYRGLLEQAYGRTLAADGEAEQSTVWLARARDRFLSLGARPFLDRCERDLAALSPARIPQHGTSLLELSGREREIAHLIARGLTNKEIAAELFLSVKTVEYHLGNIYRRFNLTGRRQLRDHVQGRSIMLQDRGTGLI
ncbi:helix-turn-helix transcriptional regulator [Streptomyces spinoverrucosus]|uniref:helix-turn-helix transcriptional regulator n=1 Tax=Streptomyces spinoverrucosus TaxID=284043 RepID=UPI00142F0512|nr:LuxR family transcriptional regulator [Streptomyces spinoverrucosus]